MIGVRISEVTMQKSNDNQTAAKAHRQVQSSTTLNRRYVRRPARGVDARVPIKRSPKVQHFAPQVAKASPAKAEEPIAPAQTHPVQGKVNARMQSRTKASAAQTTSKLTAQQLKDQAIKKALATTAATKSTDTTMDDGRPAKAKHHFGVGRVVLALSCAAAAVFAIVYFVNLNMPDISLRVAAMQTGIEATYPGYIPRDFSLSGIVSEEGKITLNFENSASGDAYSITEESSSWDSNALLNNFVKERYGDNYSVVREQGLTIYISGSDAAWANGGIVYKLDTTSGSLTKKQISSIATSL